MNSSSVPKFSSFRPKPKDPTNQDDSNHSKPRHDHGRRDSGDSRRTSSPPRARDSKRHRHRSPARGCSPHAEDRPSSTDNLTLQTRTASRKDDDKYFMIDRKGDPSNLTYGSLNRYRIPTYRRHGSGCVLGIPTNRRIDRDLTTDHNTYISSDSLTQHFERPLTSKRQVRENTTLVQFIKVAGTNVEFEEDADFIAISSNRKRKRNSETPSSQDERGNDYSGIDGVAHHAGEPEESDTEFAMGSSRPVENDLDSPESQARRTNMRLSSKTRKEPHNLQCWLDLVDHQGAVIKANHFSGSRTMRNSDQRNLADIRISIYEQALQHFTKDRKGQIELTLGLMTEGSKCWDSERLRKKWEVVLREYPENIAIWTQYLDYKQTSFVDFKYEAVKANYHACLKILATPNISDVSSFSELQVYIIVRLTVMIEECGYQELALAIWQALLEYHIFRPGRQTASNGTIDDLAHFEDFWESEVPRIGEPEAQGWKQFSQGKKSASLSRKIDISQTIRSEAPFEDFANREMRHMQELRYPGRTTDDATEDDPFHLIFFSDVEQTLALLHRNIPHSLLVQGFLCFSHLPAFPRADTQIERSWWQDSFLRNEVIEPLSRRSHAFVGSFEHYLSVFVTSPMPKFEMTTESLFDRSFTKPAGPNTHFLRCALKQLAQNLSDERIAEYCLAFEFNYFRTDALKTAKQLLKARPSSLRLYDAYAMMEARLGHTDKADQVWGKALSMLQNLSDPSQRDKILLWHNWIWSATQSGDTKKALHLFSAIDSKELVSTLSLESRTFELVPAVLLKVRAILTESLDHAYAIMDYEAVVLYTSCLALFTYLSNNFDLLAALTIHQATSTSFKKRKMFSSPFAELNYQSQARLAAYHATHSKAYMPSLIRGILEDSISVFPCNTILLSLYAANESRFRLEDRVRTIMYDTVLHSTPTHKSTIIASYFSIHLEMLRSSTAGSTTHSVRAMFEHAEESENGKRSAALWTSHVLFELEQAKKTGEGERVKRVFLKGLTYLPWCKRYMMLAFTHLREILAWQELRRVYNVMMEKELRIYVNLEGILEEIERRGTVESGEKYSIRLLAGSDSSEDD